MRSNLSPRLILADGHEMPQLGLGVYKVDNDSARDLVDFALQSGYRLIDTAAMYDNESGVGEGIARSGVPRDEIFVTTKFWMDDLGYEKTLAACVKSLKLLGLEYLDLYMIHWPAPERELYTDSWKAMEKLRQDGLVHSIGMSNFHPEHLNRIFEIATAQPAVNQVELHPWLSQEDVISYHATRGITTQAWSPLARGQILDAPELSEIARSHEKSVSQIVLRWHVQRGYSIVPKSVRPERVLGNSLLFDFDLTADQMVTISGMNRNFRTGADPNDRN